MPKKPTRSKRKESRERASRGAMRSGVDRSEASARSDARRLVTPAPSSRAAAVDVDDADEGERASAPPARAEVRRRRRDERPAAPKRAFAPVRADDPVAPPIARGPAARNERRVRALWGFLALLAVGGVAGWFFLNRDPKPDHNMVTVDVAGTAKDPVRPGDRVDVVGAPPIPRPPPDKANAEPAAAPQVKEAPVAPPPTAQAPPAPSEPPPTAPPNVGTAKPAAPKPSAAPKPAAPKAPAEPAKPPAPKAPDAPPY